MKTLPALLKSASRGVLPLVAIITEVLFTLVLVLVIALASALSMSWSRESLARLALEQVRLHSSFELTYDALTAPRLNHWQLGHLHLGYQGQTLIEIRDLRLIWQWEPLTRQQLVIEQLGAYSVFVNAAATAWPTAPDTPPEADEAAGLPTWLENAQLALHQLRLHQVKIAHPSLPEQQLFVEANDLTYGPLGAPAAPYPLGQVMLHMDEGRQRLSANLTPGALDIHATLKQLPLALLEPFLPELKGGWLSANLHATGPLEHLVLSGDLETDTKVLDLPLKARAELSLADQQLVISHLDGHWGELRAQARGTVDLKEKQLQIDIASASAPLAMLTHFKIALPPELQLDLNVQQVRVEGPFTAPRYAGKVQGKGRYRQQAFTAAAQAEGDIKQVRIQRGQLNLGKANAQINGLIRFDGHFDARVKLAQLDLGLLALAGLAPPPGLALVLDGEVTARGPFAFPAFSGQFSGSSTYKDWQADFSTRLNGTPARLVVDDLTTRLHPLHPPLEPSVASLHGRGSVQLDQRRLDLQLTGQALPLTLVSLADQSVPEGLEGALDFSADIRGPWTRPALQLKSTLTGSLHQQALRVQLEGQSDDQGIEVPQLELTLGEAARIQASGHYRPDALALHTRIGRVSLEALRALGINAPGSLEGELHLQSRDQQLHATGQLNYELPVPHLDRDQTTPVKVAATLNTHEEHLILQLLARRLAKPGASEPSAPVPPIADLSLTLPQAPYQQLLQQWLKGEKPATLPLEAQVKGHAELAALQFLLDRDIHQFGGQLALDLQASGTATTPQATGQLTLDKGFYHNRRFGTALNDIGLALDLSEKAAIVRRFEAHTPDAGRLTLTGQTELAPPFALSFDLAAHQATLMQRSDMQGVFSGNLNLTRSEKEFLLAGNLLVRPMTFRVTSGLGQSIPEIEVVTAKQKRPKAPTALPLQLDIRLVADQQAFIRGNVLETELKGQVQVKGPASWPEVAGKFETIRGHAELFGKRFALVRGNVSFLGTSALLQVVAEHQTKEETIRAELSGTPEDLKISLSSIPELPQDEIMARLLFGKSARSMTPMQAVRLGAAIQSLQGGPSRIPDPIEYTRELMGVDQLSVESASTETGSGVKVGVGKYVTERVYMEVERVPDPTQPWQGKVDIELRQNLHLQTTTGRQSAFGGVELLWKRDY